MTDRKPRQLARGNDATVGDYTGPPGELIVNTTTRRVHVQDGATQGGTPTARLADLNDYAPLVHMHDIADVTGLQGQLDGKQPVGSYAPLVHTHQISDVTGLQSALDGKAPTSHTHTIAQITNLQTTLDSKANTASLGTAAALDVGTLANQVVQLDGDAKLPPLDGSQLQNLPGGGLSEEGRIRGRALGAGTGTPQNLTPAQVVAIIESELPPVPEGGGMFKGNNGTVGSRSGDIFRVNAQLLDTNTTIAATENASATGPLEIDDGVILEVADGGSLAIL